MSKNFYRRFKARFAHASIPALFEGTDWTNAPPTINTKTPTTQGVLETLAEAVRYYTYLYTDKGSIGADLLLPLLEQKQISKSCLLYTSPSPRDQRGYRMPSSA